tara:strand:- start:1062 stop:2261 length:1200 start_codon:yes stop_codon:yes gene_type:complete
MATKINCLELFAGCGGLGYGFHTEGFTMVCANELEAVIAGSYERNFADTTVIAGDITKSEIKKQIYDCFNAEVKCDVILGGPPCVAYSMSGHRNSRDPRGQLFNDYVSVVSELKPKVFIMENVKGILTIMHDKPTLTKAEQKLADKYYKLEADKIMYAKLKKNLVYNNNQEDEEYMENETNIKATKKNLKKMASDFDKFRMNVTDIIKDKFKGIGYKVDMKLLKASDFGVPQNRERVIFIGIRNDIDREITYPEETHNTDGSDGKKKHQTVKEAIDDLKDTPENKETHQIYTKHSEAFTEKIKNTKIGESVNKKYTEAFFRCSPDKPSNTVKENHGGVFVHYEKNRVMTPRELARLQSFPDDYRFNGTKSSVLVQLGNAVPCGLSHAIAKEIKKIFMHI